MKVERFIAGRLRFEGKIATIAIAISFLVMIIAVSVSSGFRREIRRGVAEVAGDVRITSVDMNFLSEDGQMEADASWRPALDSIEGIRSISPVIYRAGIVRNGGNIHGVLFKGVSTSDTVSLQVRIPSRLAGMLSLKEGDGMLTYFIGEKVKARKFVVKEIYDSILDMDDALIVYADIDDLRKLNGWEEGEVSALEIALDDRFESPAAIEEKNGEIGMATLLAAEEGETRVLASSVIQRYPELFNWLDLIDFNVVLILVLMTVVAGFNMISGLLILLFRHISTIGVLKAMGMTDRHISSVFLRVSSTLILKGMLVGNVIAAAICLIQGQTHLLKLDPENYFVQFVPMHLDVPMILVADAVSYIVIMCLLILPCMFISRVDPAKTVRSA